MKRFFIRRVLLGVLVLFGVLVITFFITRILPSDPARQWAGLKATAAQVEQAREELHLNEPLTKQFQIYLSDLLKGNFGKSIQSKQLVLSELKSKIPATLELVLVANLFAFLVGIPLGMYSAARKNKWFDNASRVVSVGNVSIPTFVVALVLQLVFYRWLGWLPLGERINIRLSMQYAMPQHTGFLLFDCLLDGNMPMFWIGIKHIILPALTISLYPMGLVARMTRSALVEILGEDYIKAARSYGLRERTVLWKYALKNSLGTTMNVLALSLGYALTNTFLAESIFSWPGIGAHLSTAVITLDYPVIIGVTLFAASAYIILNLIADLLIAIDPRVRLQ